MPTYAYACTNCDHSFDLVQSFSEDPLTICPECEGRLRKVYGSIGITFKGSGFYRTDSRSSSSIPGSSGGGDGGKSDGDGSAGSAKNSSGGGDGGKSDGGGSAGSAKNSSGGTSNGASASSGATAASSS